MYCNIFVLLIVISLSSGEDYYELLGIKRDANDKEIRKAFKKLAVTLHPDKNTNDPEAHNKFVKLTTAYEILKDSETRKKYDIYGEEGLSNGYKAKQYQSWSYYQNQFGIYDDDPQVETLNRHDYNEKVLKSESIWFINFYSPMCSHCHHLAPVWRQVAKELEGVVRIGAVNCEDDWHLCRQINIRSYPTLLYYSRHSTHGVLYTAENTREHIISYVLSRLDVRALPISTSLGKRIIQGLEATEGASLLFICGINRDCFTTEDHLKIAAILNNMVTVRVLRCSDDECDDTIPHDIGVAFQHNNKNMPSDPVFFEDIDDVQILARKVLEQLPEPQDLSEEDFLGIRTRLRSDLNAGWLICFYIGHATQLDVQLKKLPGIIQSINLGKVNCGKYSNLCKRLNVNHYPVWGVLKPGGAFELHHGKDSVHDIASFATESIRATNVHMLSVDEILSIMNNKKDSEAWLVDWFAPWCPPCIRFLPELRKASLHFEPSVVHFGTVDCTVHSTICRQFNIRSYPTAMLVNNSNTNLFSGDKIAASLVEFITEMQNPTVIKLTTDDFHLKLGKKTVDEIWLVDYFAPWCGPCQQLAPQWTLVAKTLQVLPRVHVASVNCELEPSLCSSQGIRSYPTIRLYPTGSKGLNRVALYNGARDSLSILSWVTEFLPVNVKNLNLDNFDDMILPRKEAWLVDFFAPWCHHCIKLQPHYNIAAQILEGKVRFAKVNCENYRLLCRKASVRAYPTVMLYFPGQKYSNEYDGSQINTASASKIVRDVETLLSTASRSKRDEL
ncbi:dnaJ homolog subfamily C member 10-like isoform X1 [Neodiprion fabricii]|uniref:dnaJ homolog subfamily C member 10-like isoform X1 n=2 Tax=Neodiprion fabricii TaxID=2872261 RepID=UPI001ED95C42|nr:dnaJ homolog subfamily C member 10-like isoform X1 [Neodiprion fabricii]